MELIKPQATRLAHGWKTTRLPLTGTSSPMKVKSGYSNSFYLNAVAASLFACKQHAVVAMCKDSVVCRHDLG